MKKKRIAVLTLTFIFSFFAMFLYASSLALVKEKKEERKFEARTVMLNVTGMTCGGCPSSVKKALKALPGVEDVKVNFKNKTAIVTVKKKGGTSDDDLIKALKKAGFGGSVIKEKKVS